MTPDSFFLSEWHARRPGERRSLPRARSLAATLGLLDEQARPVLSVVGSKGKGTTAICASAFLAAAGCRVVTVTSPGYRSAEERIRVDGQAISPAGLLELADRLRAALGAGAPGADRGGTDHGGADRGGTERGGTGHAGTGHAGTGHAGTGHAGTGHAGTGHAGTGHAGTGHGAAGRGATDGYLAPTGLFTLAGMLHARDVAADVTVLEAGMGGISDEISLFTPTIAALTPIFAEHVGVLGDTPAEIAREKAGIVAPSTRAVLTLPQADDVAREIAETVRRRSAGRVRVEVVDPGSTGITPALLPAGLSARNAVLGCAAAARLLEVLGRPRPARAELAAVLGSLRLPGRLSRHQLPGSATELIVDSAINRAGITAALAVASRWWPGIDHVLLCLPDHKDVPGAIGELAGLPVTFVRLPDERLRFTHPLPAGWTVIDAADLTRDLVAGLGHRVLALGTVYFTGRVLDLVDADTERLFVCLSDCADKVTECDASAVGSGSSSFMIPDRVNLPALFAGGLTQLRIMEVVASRRARKRGHGVTPRAKPVARRHAARKTRWHGVTPRAPTGTRQAAHRNRGSSRRAQKPGPCLRRDRTVRGRRGPARVTPWARTPVRPRCGRSRPLPRRAGRGWPPRRPAAPSQ